MSVPDIGRSLRLARERGGYSLDDMAERTGVPTEELEALESGTVGRLADRVETLRSLRNYALALRLPGNDYVLATLDLWPSVDAAAGRGGPDSGQVPVVSVSSAPAGGHSPAEALGTIWVGDRTGVTAGSVSASVDGALSTNDANALLLVDTGEIPAIRPPVSRSLKVLVTLAAVLVLIGGFTLFAHQDFSRWHHDLSADTTRWIHDAKVATGISPRSTPAAAAKPGALPSVKVVPDLGAHLVTINVGAASFSVKLVAFGTPSWMQVTSSDQSTPLYRQVMPAGVNQTFPVDHSLTVETGATSARAYIYEGSSFIGAYFPTQAPFTMTFNATG